LLQALRASGLNVGAIKPVATGLSDLEGRLVSSDGLRLIEAIDGPIDYERVVPMQFVAPLAPPVAARREGVELTMAHLHSRVEAARHWWSSRCDAVVIEGVGGFLCPIAVDATVADLAVQLGYPVMLVARAGLGALNHTLLTIEAIRRRGLEVAAIVLNQTIPQSDEASLSNPAELARWLPGVGPLVSICYNEGGVVEADAFSKLGPRAWLKPPRGSASAN
jgi:dethiobiotin synthetase